MIDTRLIRSFVAVAEELHFGRAAQRLNISQPPLSRQIQQVEEIVGVPLLLRTRRGVELTEAGRHFLEEARSTLRQVERAVEAARGAAGREGGRLLVGFIDAAIYSVVPEIAKRFAERHPSVELVLADMLIPDQIEAVAERRLHVGLVHPPVDRAGLSTEDVLREPLVVALPDTHPLAGRDAVELSSLAGETLVQFPRAINPTLYDSLGQACRDAGFEPGRVQHASPKQTIVGLVSVGLGVSILPAGLRRLRRPGVAYRPLTGARLMVTTSLVWRSDETSANVTRFRDVVRELCRAPNGSEG